MVDAQKLIDYINETGNLGVDATSISMHFGIWRNDAVVLLDSLIAEGRLTKKGSKPILYFLPSTYSVSANSLSTEEDTVPFSNMIGYNGSLAMQTQMALAASSYPPHGIHTLIEGETGVGKTLLACEMARNLKSIKAKNNEEAPFVMFNCAEYANNPQLLLSQLFGYAKGSFTGAVKDKAGLIEEANGGVLFLDEIHRLPPTGQEMLFAVIDKGIFRRMGDTTDRFARFMLIGATTEDPAESLLSTFKRRMPLTIEIPSLSERPINERLDIISLFFGREANNLCLPIRVSCAALRLLISCKGKNNIGDLRNEIQLACARAYLKHIQDGSSTVDGLELEVDVYALSRRLAIDYSADEKVDAYFSSIGIAESVCYVPEKKVKDREEMVHAPSLTGLFDNQFKSLSIASQSPREIVKVILSQLEKQSNITGRGILYGSISPAVWETTNEIMSIAEEKYKTTFTQETATSVAYFLQQLKAYASAERIIFSPSKFENKIFNYDLSFSNQILPIISKNLHLNLMEGEVSLLCLLFSQKSVNNNIPYQNLILVGYGKIASAIAKSVNSILHTECAVAFDLPEEAPNEEINLKCSDYIAKNRKDTIALTGLGASQFIEKILASTDNIRYCIIPYLDLMLALACGQLVLSSSPIDSTVSEILTACKEYFGISFENCMPISTNRNSEKTACSPGEDVRNVIITYCITGIGSARAVRELLLKNLSIVATTDIIPLGIMDDISTISKDLGERLKLIIGITNPQIPGVPFINMEQVFSYTSIEGVLQANGIHIPTEKDLAIDPEDSVEALPASARLDYCYSCLDYFSPSLPKEKVDATVKNMIKSIEQMYVSPMSPDFLVRVYIHCCTMFERMHTAKPIPMPLDADVTICQNLDWYTRLQEIMLDACKAMAIEYEKSEAYYLMMALPTDDLIYHKVEKGEG